MANVFVSDTQEGDDDNTRDGDGPATDSAGG
jgi:hypothetical protein